MKNVKYGKLVFSVSIAFIMVSVAFAGMISRDYIENPVTDSEDTNEVIDFQISAGEYEIIENTRGYHEIIMLDQGYGMIQSPGDPALPEKILELQVPRDIDWSSLELEVETKNPVVLAGLYNIAPSPPLVTGSCSDEINYEDWGYDKNIRDGKNVAITTPTASGKTLAFNLPVFDLLGRDPDLLSDPIH